MFTTITTAGRRGLVIVLTVCSLAIPASATAFYGSAHESGAAGNRSAGNPARDSGLVIPDHSALDASLAPVSGSGVARGVGQPPVSPVLEPAPVGDRFDWADAALGAGVAMALVALGAAALTAGRRHQPA